MRGQFTCKYRVRVARVWTWSSSSVTWAPAAAALEDGTTHCSRRLPRPSLSVDRTDLSNRTRTVARARSAGVSTVRAASPGDWAPVDQRKRDARPGNPARPTPRTVPSSARQLDLRSSSLTPTLAVVVAVVVEVMVVVVVEVTVVVAAAAALPDR